MSEAADDITCRELVELVTDYIEGALAARDRERLEAHLEICSACRDYVDQIRGTIAAVGRVEAESLDPATREGLIAAFREWGSGADG